MDCEPDAGQMPYPVGDYAVPYLWAGNVILHLMVGGQLSCMRVDGFRSGWCVEAWGYQMLDGRNF